MSVEKYPNNPMLGCREIVNGKVALALLFLAMSFCGFFFSNRGFVVFVGW
jgi:hypothetical protein